MHLMKLILNVLFYSHICKNDAKVWNIFPNIKFADSLIENHNVSSDNQKACSENFGRLLSKMWKAYCENAECGSMCFTMYASKTGLCFHFPDFTSLEVFWISIKVFQSSIRGGGVWSSRSAFQKSVSS